jgi:hypothetical protein
MNMTKTLTCIALGSALVLACRAHAETIEDGRYWFNVNVTGPTPVENLRWYAEFQTILRPALSYALSEQASVWLGYAYVVTHPAGKPAFDEHRYWQQFLYNFSPIQTLSIQSRTRIEQRQIEDSSDTGHKLRQMFRLTLPSNINPKLQWVFYDEYFVNLNDTDYGAVRGFDQNRAFVGLNWEVSAQAKLEVGYLNQFVNRPNNIDLENHILSTTLMLKF